MNLKFIVLGHPLIAYPLCTDGMPATTEIKNRCHGTSFPHGFSCPIPPRASRCEAL